MGLAKYYEDNWEIAEERRIMKSLGNDPIVTHDTLPEKGYVSEHSVWYCQHKTIESSKSITASSKSRSNGSTGNRNSGNTCDKLHANLLNRMVYIPKLGLGTIVYTSSTLCKVQFATGIQHYSPKKTRKHLVQPHYSENA